jgi:hypothetical protein
VPIDRRTPLLKNGWYRRILLKKSTPQGFCPRW